MKIHVTGNAGSGKSTLAKKLSEMLGIPLYGLDKVVWKENWVPATIDERQEKIRAITDKSCWVIDGVSKEARAEAELIIFLDRNSFRCAYRAIKRNVPYLFTSRPDLPKNCPEIIILPQLLKIIFSFNSQAKPAILQDLKNKRHVILNSDVQTNEYLATFVHNEL